MTPNFALDLSEDGIVLLHRLPDEAGWKIVAEVALDGPDLAGELKGLRGICEGLEGPEFTTKLVLPPSQLLYASIPVGHDVQGDVERALEARTPYAIDDLSYDIRGTSPEVQVVAVARDTLREAEGFIEPYELNAVGFTASPDQTLFPGEPNLGPTAIGETMGFETDLDPVVALDPETNEATAEPQPEAVDDPVAEDAEAAAVDVEELVEAEAAEEKRGDEVEEDAAPDQEEAPVEKEPEPEPVVASEDDPPDIEETSVEPDAAEPEEVEAATPETTQDNGADTILTAPAAFSSRRHSGGSEEGLTGERVTKLTARMSIPDKAPKLGGAKPKPLSKQPSAPTLKVPPPLSATPRSTPPPVIPVARTAAEAEAPSGPGKLAAAEPDAIAAFAGGDVGGKPRNLGLILTLILLVALGLFALLSSLLLPDNAIARLFSSEDDGSAVITAVAPDGDAEEAADIEFVSLPGDPLAQEPEFAPPSEPDFAVEEPTVVPIPAPAQMTLEDAETAYALNGVWQKAPELDNTIVGATLDDLYIASLDRATDFEDAPALASFPTEPDDIVQVNPVPPPPPDIRFAFDERGLIRPSPQGSVNPEGVLIFSGPPPIAARQRPDNLVPEAAPEVDDRLSQIRPQPRPGNLVETQERATLGGLSRAELAAIRPQQRPQSEQARAEAIAAALAEAAADSRRKEEAEAVDPFASATRFAVASSRQPTTRPRDFNRIVTAARRAQERRQTQPAVTAPTQTASAATASPSRGSGPAVARSSRTNPTGAVSAAVARAATDNNALALGRVSLVGVFGTSKNRRALVRMPNGRFKKVSVGDRVDGGRVAAIGGDQLRYTKGGRTVTLKMPKG